MKTITYYRTKRGRDGIIYEPARGYEYNIVDHRAVASVVIGRTPTGRWTITHAGSGYLASPRSYKTRKEAENALTPDLCAAIIEKLLTPEMTAACQRLAEYLNPERGRAC